MNEQFRLPAQEWLGYDPERGDIHGYTPEQMREFAELIVRECADIAYKIVWDDLVHGYGQSVIPLHVHNSIKEHFGVEE